MFCQPSSLSAKIHRPYDICAQQKHLKKCIEEYNRADEIYKKGLDLRCETETAFKKSIAEYPNLEGDLIAFRNTPMNLNEVVGFVIGKGCGKINANATKAHLFAALDADESIEAHFKEHLRIPKALKKEYDIHKIMSRTCSWLKIVFAFVLAALLVTNMRPILCYRA